jgi:hypothetical protein
MKTMKISDFYLDFQNPVLEQRLDRWNNKKIALWIQRKKRNSDKRISRTAKRLKRMRIRSNLWRIAEIERLEKQTKLYMGRIEHREREAEMWD